jgi:hypothetical protein
MQRTPTDTENKLLLLHAIDCLGGVTAHQLLLFMVENDAMGYIEVQLGLAELVDANLLKKQKHALGTLYELTAKGRDSLLMFCERVPHSRLVAIEESAAAFRRRFRLEKQMIADFEKIRDGAFCVSLRLIEKNESLMDIKINVPTQKIAQQFCDAWIAQASGVYSYIMYALGEADIEPGREA